MFKKILVVSALAFLETELIAQQNQQAPQRLEETVVTAEKVEVPISQVGSSVTVISEDDIKASNVTSTGELIQKIEGTTVTQQGGVGELTGVFIRGAASANTLVLIDGVKANSPTTAGFDFSTITTDNIERIEVLRGPQSSLYGSEAMGGVINIITKKGAGNPSVTLTGEGGSFKTDKESASVMYGDNKLDFSFSQSHFGTNGIPAASFLRGNQADSGDQNFTTSAHFGLNFAKDGRLDFSLRYVNATIGLAGFNPVTFLPADAPSYTQLEHSLFSSLVVKKPMTSWWTPSLKLSLASDSLADRDPNIVEAVNLYASPFFLKTLRKDIEFQNEMKVADFYSFVAGYEYKNDDGFIQGTYHETTFTNSFYLENRFNVKDIFYFTLGGRNDFYNTFGNHQTYRSTVALLINSIDAKIHASGGSGFRAPSLNELFFPGFGVTTLNPEKSKGFDIGIQKYFFDKRISIDPTFFYNKFDDLIVAAPPLFMAANINEASSKGAEMNISLLNITKGVNAILNYTYNDTRDFSTNSQLARRPWDKASVSIDFKPFPKLTISPSYLMVHGRMEVDGTSMSDYAVVNLNVSYMATDNVKIYGRIVNLFDRKYEDVKYYSSYPFSFYLGTQISF